MAQAMPVGPAPITKASNVSDIGFHSNGEAEENRACSESRTRALRLRSGQAAPRRYNEGFTKATSGHTGRKSAADANRIGQHGLHRGAGERLLGRANAALAAALQHR